MTLSNDNSYVDSQQYQQHDSAPPAGGGASPGGTQSMDGGVPHWLKRLRRVDRSLATAIEASVTVRQQAMNGFGGGQFQADDDDFYDQNNVNNVSASSSVNNSKAPLISPNEMSPPRSGAGRSNAVDGLNSSTTISISAPANNMSSSSSSAVAGGGLATDVTFPSHQQNKNNLIGGPAAASRSAARSSTTRNSNINRGGTASRLTIPSSAVTTCVICRGTPREVSILEDEVARLRAFVTVQRESFQMQLDDIKEQHAAETKSTTEAMQADLNDRLVAYRREVDDLRGHLSMAEGVVVQFAKLKDQHADLTKRYQALLQSATKSGGGGAAAAAAASPATPADQRSSNVNSNNSSRDKADGDDAAVAQAEWQVERLELLAEVDHWKRQATVSGVAARTAAGTHLHNSSNDPSPFPTGSSPSPQQHPQYLLSQQQQMQQQQRAVSGSGGGGAAGGAAASTAMPDALKRLEAWRTEVNPNAVAASSSMPRNNNNNNNVEVSPTTLGGQTPSHRRGGGGVVGGARLVAPLQQQRQAPPGHQQQPQNRFSSVSSASSMGTTASSGQLESERQRWLKLMDAIVGPSGGGDV